MCEGENVEKNDLQFSVCEFCGQMSFVPDVECNCELRRLHFAALGPCQGKAAPSPAVAARPCSASNPPC